MFPQKRRVSEERILTSKQIALQGMKDAYAAEQNAAASETNVEELLKEISVCCEFHFQLMVCFVTEFSAWNSLYLACCFFSFFSKQKLRYRGRN